ncbi:hypothetical protein [Rhodovulum sp. ES.010]|uniref:hypothetical protein n=1 Tax=Rhodovulum sp. ES.010 TaxID=1882821 RepID=UPI001587FEC4|nr:hypothetical protein [Rhodovulum sp. ES.010]
MAGVSLSARAKKTTWNTVFPIGVNRISALKKSKPPEKPPDKPRCMGSSEAAGA